MIIILSAASCTGKTLMANNLMRRYHMPFTMMDNLKMGMFRSNPDCGFHPEDPVEHIAECLWPFMREMIKTSIENGQDMILEGCYLLPKHLMELEDDYRREVLPIFFGFSESYLNNCFESGVLKHRCVVEQRDYEENRPLTQFKAEHSQLKILCEKANLPYFEIKEHYDEVEDIYQYIDSEMGEWNETD